MNITRIIVLLGSGIKYLGFIRACKNPIKAQKSVWLESYHLISKERDIKKNLRDNPITSINDYIDIFDSDKYITKNPLTDENILFWAQSAGTTGKQKIFPLTKSYRKQFQRSIAPFLYKLLKRYKKMMILPSLYLAATDPDSKSKGNIPIGYISNFNYHHMPQFIKNKYAIPDETLKDSKTYLKDAPLYALGKDLNNIFAVTPLSINKFLENIINNWSSLMSRINNKEIQVSDERISYLNSLKIENLNLKGIWPNIEFICCWKSSICSQQLNNMKELIGDVDVVDAIYSATEGWINVPDPIFTHGGAIHPGTHVLEFLKVGSDLKSDNLINLWDLDIGSEYEIFITNNMGLVRYRLKDIISCTGYFHRSPIIHFVRKMASELSLGLVTIAEDELVDICQSLNIQLDENHFFCPNQSGDGLLYCFCDNAPSSEILKKLDDELKIRNVNYEKYINNNTLKEIAYNQILKEPSSFHAQTKPKYLKDKYREGL